jgi:hypothetical protein
LYETLKENNYPTYGGKIGMYARKVGAELHDGSLHSHETLKTGQSGTDQNQPLKAGD